MGYELKKNTQCRVCKHKEIEKVISFGKTPLANAFLAKEKLSEKEQLFPLELYFCGNCGFVQLSDIVSPELLFKDYLYVSSTSPVFVKHFLGLAEKTISRFGLKKNSFVVDIGSNDGVLLKPFQENGMKVLGIDPAEKIAELATKNGITTLPLFFSKDTAKQVVQKYGHAIIATATSVFSHVDGLDDFLDGIKELLDDQGVFIIEVYYLKELLEKNLFDLVYHEHMSYFTLNTMSKLMERNGLEVFDAEVTDTHGGSLRAFVQKKNGPHRKTAAIQTMLSQEENKKLSQKSTYTKFAQKIEENKAELKKLLSEIKSKGKKIAGYGAPAKGNTLLNYFDIGTQTIDYIVDDSKWKQGLYTPGKHIPVYGFEYLQKNRPDYILILAWNFAESIMKKCAEFDKFILPVPNPVILSSTVEQDLETIVESIKTEAKSLEGKTMLITGGSGFIGSYMVATIDHLNRKCLQKPCKVISVDNHIVGKSNNLIKEIKSDNVQFIEHNVCNPFEIDAQADYIVSAAGVASPVYYKKFPIETIEGTIFGIKNTLELARKQKSKSILFFSSSEIYGDPAPEFIPTPETYKGNVSSTGDRSCYDESKRVGETICMAYHRVHGTPVKIVRPFNVFGPGMKGTDYRVIPAFLSQGARNQPLTVHDKGNQTRTFCYVTDAITGFFKVLLSDKNGQVFNVGNDNDEINIRSLADMIAAEIFENKAKVNMIKYPENYPQDEPKRRCPDLKKIKSMLGYSPKIDLKTGLKRSYAWFKANAL